MTGARQVAIVRQPDAPLTGAMPVAWAIEELRAALVARGIGARVVDTVSLADPDALVVLIADADLPDSGAMLARAGVTLAHVPEAFGLVPASAGAVPDLLACAADVRGFVYAALELADRVTHARDPFPALVPDAPVMQQPANRVRSVARLFTCEAVDKPWFHDEAFWRRYLSMLVAQRFNRVSLTLGLGYNFPWHVTDAYLYFAYPFLVDVPGYRVRVPQLPDAERVRNLEMLRFISQEAAARGLEFQLGLWTHAYEWLDSPAARHTIDGLTPETHAPYCGDALHTILEACPDISGVTLRTHGESGIPEGGCDFWRQVFEGAARSGRRVRLDLHSKGLDRETVQLARATGLPLTVSPKYAAEHMGLPAHQAAIRDLERPVAADAERVSTKDRYMTVSEGNRSFTRYGYADFLREDRDFDVVFRVWPGTQRLLLWGDPAMARGLGRHAGIGGARGLEWCEPLSFRGREGSALSGSRDGYADRTLSTGDDWRKYEYTYRLIGRLAYDPDADPDAWRRHLRASFGGAAASAEGALANASRILPLVTTAHHPSASNNYYWPEMYSDMPIVVADGASRTHYYDTPEPKRFGTVGPLDPEVFTSVDEFVDEVLTGSSSGRYSPLEVAGWLEHLAATATRELSGFRSAVGDASAVEARQLDVDVAIQAALGRFFAGKLRAAVWHAFAERTGSRLPLIDALAAHRAARAAWAEAADRGATAYVQDVAFGPQPWLRGAWSDRLPAIDRDLAAMIELARSWTREPDAPEEMVRALFEDVRDDPSTALVDHRPPTAWRRGRAIEVVLDVDAADAATVVGVRLRYRRLNQSDVWDGAEMVRGGNRFHGAIPADVAGSSYPVQYAFVLRDARGRAWRYPGLGADLSDQPYFVIRQERR